MIETLFPVPDEWWVHKRCPVCRGAFTPVYQHTYVVQRQWWVKIGATNMPRRRINELSRPAWAKYILYPEGMDWTEPLLTHAVLPWVGDREHDLHQRFQKQHVIGEWFLPDAELREWIEEVTCPSPS